MIPSLNSERYLRQESDLKHKYRNGWRYMHGRSYFVNACIYYIIIKGKANPISPLSFFVNDLTMHNYINHKCYL